MMISPELEEYCEIFSSTESELLKTIRLKTAEKFSASQMVCGPIVAHFLQLLIKLKNAVRILDLGTFTGYSAIAMAEALSALDRDGPNTHVTRRVISIEKSREAFELSGEMLDQTELKKYVDLKHGEALSVLETLNDLFDLIFIDADKASTLQYYEWSLSHLATGGVIVVDDVLWYGKVLDPSSDKRALAMHQFNERVKGDSRVFHILLPVRHGLQVILKI